MAYDSIKVYHEYGGANAVYSYLVGDTFVFAYRDPLLGQMIYEDCDADDTDEIERIEKEAQEIIADLYGRRLIEWSNDEYEMLTDQDKGTIKRAYLYLDLERAKMVRQAMYDIRCHEYQEDH